MSVSIGLCFFRTSDAKLHFLCSLPCIEHLAFVVYIRSGGVLNELWFVEHSSCQLCFYIPDCGGASRQWPPEQTIEASNLFEHFLFFALLRKTEDSKSVSHNLPYCRFNVMKAMQHCDAWLWFFGLRVQRNRHCAYLQTRTSTAFRFHVARIEALDACLRWIVKAHLSRLLKIQKKTNTLTRLALLAKIETCETVSITCKCLNLPG